MRLLAIETSARDAAVALTDHGVVSVLAVPRSGGRHAKELVPAIDRLLGEHSLAANGLEGIVVNLGPGSFTGLRVGVTVAQTLGWLTGAATVGVPLFVLLEAASGARSDRPRRLIANAERRELFVADVAAGEQIASDVRIEPIDDALATDSILVGTIPRSICPSDWDRRDRMAFDAATLAKTLARLGQLAIESGHAVPPAQLLPIYGRRSAAEEMRDAGRRPKYEQVRPQS